MLKSSRLALLVLTVLAGGCSANEEGQAATDPAATPFVGKVDARLVGTWKTENGSSTYTLEQSGAYGLKAKIRTPGATVDTLSNGTWLVDGSMFLMKDAAGNVAKYKMALAGSRLTLSTTGSMKRDLTLVKQ